MFKGYNVVKNLNQKGNVLLLSKDGKRYVAKLKQNPRTEKNFIFLLADKLGLIKLQFQEELLFLKGLDKIQFRYFNYPKLIETDDKIYFLIEYIEGKEGEWTPDLSQKKKFVQALTDFQLAGNFIKLNWKMRIISPLFTPVGSVIRLAVTNVLKYGGFKVAMKTLSLSLKINFRTRKQKARFLIHGDLIPAPRSSDGIIYSKNLLFGDAGKIYFIDFELPVVSSKFFLSDMVDIAFNFENKSLDWEWVLTFIDELKKRIAIEEFDLEDQIRIALLRNVTSKMILKRWRKEYMDFLNKTLLSDINFTLWLENQKLLFKTKSLSDTIKRS